MWRRAIGALVASASLHAAGPVAFSFEVNTAARQRLVPIQIEDAAPTTWHEGTRAPLPKDVDAAVYQAPAAPPARPRAARPWPVTRPLEPAAHHAARVPGAYPAPLFAPGPPAAAPGAAPQSTDETPGASGAPHAVLGTTRADREALVPTPHAEQRPREPSPRALRATYLKNLRDRVAAHRRYPYQARRAGIEGTVCLKLHLDARGRLTALGSTCGAPTPALLEAALDAARAAAPFDPLPPALGTELAAELPVVFRLEQAVAPK